MNIDLVSFFLGGLVFLGGFLAIMAWIVPDLPAGKAMTWLVQRRNFSRISIFIGLVMLIVVSVIFSIAVIKLLPYVEMDPWVPVIFAFGVILFLVSLIMLIFNRAMKQKEMEEEDEDI